MEYCYKTQWGRQQEFLRFLKTTIPCSRSSPRPGACFRSRSKRPPIHLAEAERWDYRVTIRFKNSTLATTANPTEDTVIKQLWPDQATYEREEQRRFEILLAHWDVPVTDIAPH